MLRLIGASLFFLLLAVPGWGASGPLTLSVLQDVERGAIDAFGGGGLHIRNDAQREAALSYGARGGLARRTWGIRAILHKHEWSLSRVFDFRRLLIPAPSGLLVEPPIISRAQNALLISERGHEAAVSDRIYNIGDEARIVATARNWRTYLEREWDKVVPPPDVLLPKTREERARWKDWVREGWIQGIVQAEEIFETDLKRLVNDFTGMVRYRTLLVQNMVSAPYVLQVDRGITGGGDEMRIGDRAIRITSHSQLQAGSEKWTPVDR